MADVSQQSPVDRVSKHSSKDFVQTEEIELAEPTEYRLYKRRFIATGALMVLNMVGALAWPWFGPISNKTAAEFNISLDQVNWLGNIIGLVYLPTALLLPIFISKYGIRRCCMVGGITLVLSAWIRYAATVRSLPPGGAYALLFIGQIFAGIAQPIYQVMGPPFAENWFDLRGRTTATMIIGVSNPFGGAIGQIISPIPSDSRQSILVLGIIATAVSPLVFLVPDAPPTPPTYSGGQKTPSIMSLCRALLGQKVAPASYMTGRERVDFAIITSIFGVLVAASIGFSTLSNQLLQPVGYSEDESGYLGACMLLAGLAAAFISAPLLDRVFTRHLAITSKVLVPLVALGWFSLIWAVRPNNLAPLFVIMALIGICSVPMLPIGMELACEVTRNADASSAIVWFAGNLLGVVFVLALGALRASPDADPPLNMKRGLIFMGVTILAVSASIFFLHGHQKRKETDEQKIQEAMSGQGPISG